MRSKYVNLKSDWGFKHLMGKKAPMRSFLNSLLSEDYGEINSIEFKNVEILSNRPDGRGVIFDLHCVTDKGDKIIVEMQNYSQLFFKTRANYYLSALMCKEVERGEEWNKMKEDIPHLIGIFFIGKRFSNEKKPIVETEEFDRIDRVPFWNRVRKYFIFLENFDITNVEDPSPKDCWIEIIKNLGSDMYKIHPSVYEKADPALLELIERANVCNLTDDEYMRYEAGLKALEDHIDFDEMLEEAKVAAAAEGRAEGRAEGVKFAQLENARRMLEENFTVELIVKITGLSQEEIEKLRG